MVQMHQQHVAKLGEHAAFELRERRTPGYRGYRPRARHVCCWRPVPRRCRRPGQRSAWPGRRIGEPPSPGNAPRRQTPIALGQDATRRGGAHVLFRDLRTDTEHLIQLAVVRAESTQLLSTTPSRSRQASTQSSATGRRAAAPSPGRRRSAGHCRRSARDWQPLARQTADCRAGTGRSSASAARISRSLVNRRNACARKVSRGY